MSRIFSINSELWKHYYWNKSATNFQFIFCWLKPDLGVSDTLGLHSVEGKKTNCEHVKFGVVQNLTMGSKKLQAILQPGKPPPTRFEPLILIWPKCAIFWPSLAPPAVPAEFLWFEMASTDVPHIVLHVLGSTRASGGYFRPKKSVLSKIAAFGCFRLKEGGHNAGMVDQNEIF